MAEKKEVSRIEQAKEMLLTHAPADPVETEKGTGKEVSQIQQDEEPEKGTGKETEKEVSAETKKKLLDGFFSGKGFKKEDE